MAQLCLTVDHQPSLSSLETTVTKLRRCPAPATVAHKSFLATLKQTTYKVVTKSLTVCGSLGICIEMQFSANSRVGQKFCPLLPLSRLLPFPSASLFGYSDTELGQDAVDKFLSLLTAHNFGLESCRAHKLLPLPGSLPPSLCCYSSKSILAA